MEEFNHDQVHRRHKDNQTNKDDITNKTFMDEDVSKYYRRSKTHAVHLHSNTNKMYEYRFIVLVLSILANFSYYFWYDLPNSLSDLIFEKMTHEKDGSVLYNQMYTIVTLPNIFLPIFGGIIHK